MVCDRELLRDPHPVLTLERTTGDASGRRLLAKTGALVAAGLQPAADHAHEPAADHAHEPAADHAHEAAADHAHEPTCGLPRKEGHLAWCCHARRVLAVSDDGRLP